MHHIRKEVARLCLNNRGRACIAAATDNNPTVELDVLTLIRADLTQIFARPQAQESAQNTVVANGMDKYKSISFM